MSRRIVDDEQRRIALGLRTQVPSGSGGAGASAALALLDDVPASPASRRPRGARNATPPNSRKAS